MKELSKHITEALKIGSKSKVNQKHYHPKEKWELIDIIKTLLKERGYDANLNDIDVSAINDMRDLFTNGIFLNFDGNISEWDVSNVKWMNNMFSDSDFTGNNGDISNWKTNNVENMDEMFWGCKKLNININKWDVSNVKSMKNMFTYAPIKCRPSWYKN